MLALSTRHSGRAERDPEPRGHHLSVCPWVSGSRFASPGMTKWAAFALVVSALGACATNPGDAPQSEYAVQITANAEQQRFDISLQSTSARPLCVHNDDWPNAVGEMHYSADHVFAEIEGERYSIRDQNFGYCIGTRCSHRVAPGEVLSGFVSYSEFPTAPLRDASSPSLVLPLLVRYCARGEGT